MAKLRYREWTIPSQRYWGLLAILAGLAALGALAALYMEHAGHWVTGMNNQVVWGMPHVFAVFLIVAASGVLNVASISSVFKQAPYKPLARLSGLLAIALLVGGLSVLVLDLGQPTRLIVAMTTFNFKSIFAWNIFLYTGFIAIVAIYLFTLMERKASSYSRGVGVFSFIWRLALTTGTGSIFGFLVARPGFDAAIMAPMFVIMSFAYGMAIYLLVLFFTFGMDNRPIDDKLVQRLKNLLGVFVASILYFTVVFHLTNLYGTEHHGFEAFLLRDGGVYTWVFWVGWILLGCLAPIGLLFHPAWGSRRGGIIAASLLTILGGFCAMFVIIIGGQVFPMSMFPDKTVIDSGFAAGTLASYTPTAAEVMLGVGGVAVALLATVVGVRLLKFLPESLANDVMESQNS